MTVAKCGNGVPISTVSEAATRSASGESDGGNSGRVFYFTTAKAASWFVLRWSS